MRSAVLPKTWRRSYATSWVSAAILLAALLLPAHPFAHTAQEARKLAGEYKNDGVRAYQTGRVSLAVEKLTAAIDELLARPEHSWYTGNLPAAEMEKRKQAQDEFKARYGKD